MQAKITCLLLAAGLGRRFGGDNSKLLQDYNGKPIVAHSLQCLREAQAKTTAIDEIIVIVGHQKQAVSATIDGAKIIDNPNYRQGLYTSLLCGLHHSSANTDYVMVLPADMPNINPATIIAIIEAAASAPEAKIFIPTFGGKFGNPVLFHKSLQPALHEFKKQSENMDSGAMEFFSHLQKTTPEIVAHIAVGDKGILTDIDTQEDFLTIASGHAKSS